MSVSNQINGAVTTATNTSNQTSTIVTTNTSTTVSTPQGPTLKTVRSSIISNSYMFNTNLSSSSNLSHRSSECKPVPPPTLPKYTSSFNAGQKSLDNQQSQTSTFHDRDKDGVTGSSYRIAALERLAMRQRIRDSNNSTTSTTPTLSSVVTTVTTSPSVTTVSNINHNVLTNGSLTNGVSSNGSISPSHSSDLSTTSTSNLATQLQLKRDLFFSSSNVSGSKKSESKESITPQPPPKPEQSTVRAKVRHLEGYVGFANLPNQVYRKAVKQGFEFNLMVVGESGLGKSTLINSMFLTDIYSNDYPGPSLRIKKTVSVETTKVLLKEKGVNLKLTVVDTPGFGDAVDNSNCWVPILDFIDAKYDDYLNSESRVNRTSQIPDQRVHCCLYFLQPTGHGLKSLDIEFMKRLCDKVNIVPVIAKADTLTAEECQSLKKQIMTEIVQHDIKIYTFPDMNEDEDDHKLNKNLKDRVPFAVVGSNTVIEVADGHKVRGRKYPWGVVEVDSLEHCDFLALRNMIVQIHLQDLKDVTNNVHYENFRWRKLAGLGFDSNKPMSYKWNLLEQVDEEKREREEKMKAMEQEMELVFEQKVKEKIQKVKNGEAEMMKRHEATRRSLEEQAKDLDERRRQFESEKQHWERDNSITIEELQRKTLEGSKETLDGKKDKKKKGLF